MWHNNQDVKFVYTTHGPNSASAILSDLGGWHAISPDSPTGVGNVTQVLAKAKAAGRQVNVYVVDNQITHVVSL